MNEREQEHHSHKNTERRKGASKVRDVWREGKTSRHRGRTRRGRGIEREIVEAREGEGEGGVREGVETSKDISHERRGKGSGVKINVVQQKQNEWIR